MAQQMRRADQPDQLCVSSCLLPARSLCSVSVRDDFGHAGSRRPAAIVRAAADLGKCAVGPVCMLFRQPKPAAAAVFRVPRPG